MSYITNRDAEVRAEQPNAELLDEQECKNRAIEMLKEAVRDAFRAGRPYVDLKIPQYYDRVAYSKKYRMMAQGDHITFIPSFPKKLQEEIISTVSDDPRVSLVEPEFSFSSGNKAFRLIFK